MRGNAVTIGIVRIVRVTRNDVAENDHPDLGAGREFADFVGRGVIFFHMTKHVLALLGGKWARFQHGLVQIQIDDLVDQDIRAHGEIDHGFARPGITAEDDRLFLRLEPQCIGLGVARGERRKVEMAILDRLNLDIAVLVDDARPFDFLHLE